MKTTILVDNDAQEGLGCEWGFSALIETDGAIILLDSGASGLFAQNAQALGIDLADVDYCVLSHAHFDHADGFGTSSQSMTTRRCLSKALARKRVGAMQKAT